MKVTPWPSGLYLGIGLMLYVVSASRAEAQLTFGGNSSQSVFWFSDGAGSTSWDTTTLTNSTTIASRYQFNVNADAPLLGQRTQGGGFTHRFYFYALAPGGYRLDIAESYIGAISLVSDAIGCQGAADASGVTASGDPPLSGGSLGIADPGIIAMTDGSTHIPFNSTANGTIFRVSNGTPQLHTLTFTFDALVNSDSCEVMVRGGAGAGATTDCSDCGYPGAVFPRDPTNDGHSVVVTYTSLCGNGVVDGAVSEQCDDGANNGSPTSCCTGTCQLRPFGTICRPSGGSCDVQETCSGGSACPADTVLPASQICRHSQGTCDLQENCTGSSPVCPADGFRESSIECRGVNGICDVAENCTGSSAACPADSFQPSTTICRAAGTECDVAESCTGSSAACPANIFQPSSVVCRPASQVCDAAENCTGTDPFCPVDGFAGNTVVCRPSVDLCDLADFCNGSAATCPADAKSTGVCRPPADLCDAPESCNGVSDACPVDGVRPSGFACRPAASNCDVGETCNGVVASCPADVVVGAGTECRGSAGFCDVAEQCDGVSGLCPNDVLLGSETVCYPSAGVCDPAETCSGVFPFCGPNGKFTSGVCRPSAGACDPAESCNGGDDCPPDAKSTSTCREAADLCDLAEICDGVSDTCPADAKSTGVCRAAMDECDFSEICDGVADACPADVIQPNGSACDDESACTTVDECQSGACSGSVPPACAACEACLPSSGCTAAAQLTTCVAAASAKSLLRVNDFTAPDDHKDVLVWKWNSASVVFPNEFGNPLTSTHYQLCVYDETANAPTLTKSYQIQAGGICGNAACWKSTPTGFRYLNPARTPDGVLRLLFKTDMVGKGKIVLKGKGAELAHAGAGAGFYHQDSKVTVILLSSDDRCWKAQYTTPAIKNTAALFKDKN